MVGLNIKADFAIDQVVTIARLPGVYDDGYVHPGQNTQGYTGNWGYQSPSQVSGQSLMMQQTTSYSPVGDGDFHKAGPPLPGFELAYGGNLFYWKRARIGWDFGFGLLPTKITAKESSGANVDQSVFSFGIPSGPEGPVILPQPPYHGGPGGLGPQILDTAVLAGSTNGAPGSLTGSQTLDVMLYTFRLGPSVYWDFNRHVGMSVSAGPALGLVSGDLKYDEFVQTSVVAENKGQVSGTDLVYGWYANASVMYHVIKNGDVYLSAQYMPMGTATISGQGHEGRLDLRGAAYISAGVNWPF